MKNLKIKNSQNGVSLIITFFIMIIILSVILSISALLYSEIKITRNIGNSMGSLYAADSGVEKVLYYDDQVLPIVDDGPDAGIVGKRGLCTMYPYNVPITDIYGDTIANSDACPGYGDGTFDKSVYCIPDYSPKSTATDPNGCDPTVCDNCEISFSTTLENGSIYYTNANVSTSNGNSVFTIDSKGIFNGAQREVEITVNTLKPQDVISITNDCAQPYSAGTGEAINIKATAGINAAISGGDTISSVMAAISDSANPPNYYSASGSIVGNSPVYFPLDPPTSEDGNLVSGTWKLSWITNVSQEYYVSITATDSKCTSCANDNDCSGGSCCPNGFCSTTDCAAPSCTPNIKTVTKIPPCGFE